MTNKEKYETIFMDSFSIDKTKLNDKLVYESVPDWDSVGHMGLIAELEESFEIEMETDDIIDFSSFEKGKEILKKYNVKI
tara:strand:+ start:422 stop:661 length:240 start_codon:yes stop_codon:yes gene_type:complete